MTRHSKLDLTLLDPIPQPFFYRQHNQTPPSLDHRSAKDLAILHHPLHRRQPRLVH
jgi:hypothetical protein